MERKKKPTPAPRWPILAATGALFVYLGLIALWTTGIFRVARGSSDTQVLAAVLALLGGLFAAILTFVGVLVKNSLDSRTLQLARETEDRMTVETLFKGVDLLQGAAGDTAPMTRQAGALFTLAYGGYFELALMYLAELREAGQISTTVAFRLLDMALETEDERLRTEASRILLDNAKKLPTRDGNVCFPDCMDPWPVGARFLSERTSLPPFLWPRSLYHDQSGGNQASLPCCFNVTHSCWRMSRSPWNFERRPAVRLRNLTSHL